MATNESDIYLKQLSKALASTKDDTLIFEFLHSILTPNEISEVALRWALVMKIHEGNSQRKIANELGLSLCKITRGSKELKKKDSPFRKMIEKWKELSEK
ncbi:MAG: trp operon repressor [Spirochaetaceae bacterium]|nr:trp operon repressor [Spirochaetaceae bacterium]